MNKRATQDFIKRYARLAAKNAALGIIPRDQALGQLNILSQLALTSIHDRAYHEHLLQICRELRDNNYQAAQDIAAASWNFPKHEGRAAYDAQG